MTLQELWQLFPITLAEHDPEWINQAKDEIIYLSEILADCRPVIHHIGSTAIPGIRAKPIMDILVVLPEDADFNKIRRKMEKAGYICMSESGERMSFNKGYTPEGYADKVFHIHFHLTGDEDEIFFRDYLISHPEVAKEYESLKLGLLPQYRNDRDGYTAAKSE
ncbi:MAG: GrpB family protein, partial [Muribaculaceae bacterium]|nr:GrpB family protein [Muribaculaceae bacterium]